ncbi:hypothetical protein ACTG9Q_13235 [Actinokineospora sp. 24-640]
MSTKRLIIGSQSWDIPEAGADDLLKDLTAALTGGPVRFSLIDSQGRPVTVFCNGTLTVTAVVDNGGDPKPVDIAR